HLSHRHTSCCGSAIDPGALLLSQIHLCTSRRHTATIYSVPIDDNRSATGTKRDAPSRNARSMSTRDMPSRCRYGSLICQSDAVGGLSGQDVPVRVRVVVAGAFLVGACTSSDSPQDALDGSSPAAVEESSTTVATNPVTPTPLQNRIVDIRVHETSVEVEFSHNVPEHLLAEGDVPATGECSATPMPGIQEFVNVVMNVDTEDTPNGLPSDLVTVAEGTGVVERVALTCAFEAQVHMAIGLTAAASLQGYRSVAEDGPPRLVVHIAAAAKD
ncbi:MAG: hypothetical protein ABIX10_09730, partial [Acidimicrobiales bacterium]